MPKATIIFLLIFILICSNCLSKLDLKLKGVIVPSIFAVEDFKKQYLIYKNSYAIVIGINDYPKINPSRNLRHACNDALAFKKYLENYENFSDIQCFLNDKATLFNIKQSIKALFDKAGSEDRLILFFSGHGQTIGGECYLIPYDGSFDDAFASGYRLGELTDQSKSFIIQKSAKHVLIIVDACYTGLGYQTKGSSSTSLSILKNYAKKPYLGILSAASSDERAFEDNESPYSLFTRFLIQGLERGTADLTNDSIITINELFEYTRSQVQRNASDRFGNIQTPQYRHVFGEGEFVFIRKNLYSPKKSNATKPPIIKGNCSLALIDAYSSIVTMDMKLLEWLKNIIEKELNKNFIYSNIKYVRDRLNLDKPEGEYVLYPDLIIRDFGYSLKVDKVATIIIAKINDQIHISLNIIDVKTGIKQNNIIISSENKIEIEFAKQIQYIRDNL